MSVEYQNNERSAASGRSGPNIALILAAVLAAIAVIFFLQNGNESRIKFLFFSWTSTVRWSIIIAVILGIVIDRMFGIWWSRRRRRDDSE